MSGSPADNTRLRAAREEVAAQGVSVRAAEDRALMWDMLGKLVAVRVMLWTRGYAGTRARIDRRANPRPAAITPQVALTAMKIGRIANGLGRRMPFPSACLVRSLAAYWSLRARGLAPELHLGVANTDGFRAHAWVTLCDVPVTDLSDTAVDYAPFPRSSV